MRQVGKINVTAGYWEAYDATIQPIFLGLIKTMMRKDEIPPIVSVQTKKLKGKR